MSVGRRRADWQPFAELLALTININSRTKVKPEQCMPKFDKPKVGRPEEGWEMLKSLTVQGGNP
jgi:hypothetical protein